MASDFDIRKGCLLGMALIAGITAGLAGCSTPGGVHGYAVKSSPGFIGITNFASFRKSKEVERGHVVLTSPEIRTGIDWDELVVSWNAEMPRDSGLQIEARAIFPDRGSKFYTLGFWAVDTAAQRRESVPGQKDEDGDVETDTLILKRSANRLQLRVRFLGTNAHQLATLKFLGMSLLNTKSSVVRRLSDNSAWGRTLAVPERSQLAYRGGSDWCSPTSVSMVLAYWAQMLGRPELDVDVPDVAAGVYDKNWPGTGNWPFNTAFAGGLGGMRAYVTRLSDVTDLEALVAEGIPPVVSVSFDLLHGKERDQGNGHLVVCIGFTERGDVLVNDPWARLETGEPVRRMIPRETLENAWMRSRRTVYLIYPESWRMLRRTRAQR